MKANFNNVLFLLIHDDKIYSIIVEIQNFANFNVAPFYTVMILHKVKKNVLGK